MGILDPVMDVFGLKNDFQGGNANLTQGFDSNQIDNANLRTTSGLDEMSNFLNAIKQKNYLGNQEAVFKQQQDLANQLGLQAQGQGPNPALAQLASTTGQNAAHQAALMASMRGTGANAGMLARQAAMQGGAMNQQAAGQAATLSAQQQLAAQQALQQQQGLMGNLATTQVGEQSGAANAYTNAAQNYQNMVQGSIANYNQAKAGMQANINNVNSQTAQGNQQASNKLFGGLMSGAAAAMNKGGMVHKYADGGQVGPQSFATHYFNGSEPVPEFNPQIDLYKDTVGSNQPKPFDFLSAIENGKPQDASKEPSGIAKVLSAIGSKMSGGSNPMQAGQDPSSASKFFGGVGKAFAANSGAVVPGKAEEKGDSLKNDKVQALLSPKEIVLPRSVTLAENAPDKARDFVAAILAKQARKGKK